MLCQTTNPTEIVYKKHYIVVWLVFRAAKSGNMCIFVAMTRLILASKSPRRQELLKGMGLDFEVVLREVDENFPSGMSPEEAVRYIAEKKAKAFADLAQKAVILAADTIVVVDGDILGKPADQTEAIAFLHRLSGREHRVMTACALLHGERLHSFVETTLVRFSQLEEEEISRYVHSGQAMDKAGAYGIQEWIGLIGIETIQGSYPNVVGLPTAALYKALKTNFKILEL